MCSLIAISQHLQEFYNNKVVITSSYFYKHLQSYWKSKRVLRIFVWVFTLCWVVDIRWSNSGMTSVSVLLLFTCFLSHLCFLTYVIWPTVTEYLLIHISSLGLCLKYISDLRRSETYLRQSHSLCLHLTAFEQNSGTS